MQFSFQAIGVIHSCFREKFGIPRQPGLATAAHATLEFLPDFARAEAVRGLEDFSHIWIQFVFHQCLREKWKATVRPPRLGGNQRLGVFASRSTFRPNPIGLSVVKLEGIREEGPRLWLELSGMDLLDGTPVLDIKPYLPYADIIADARAGYAPAAPSTDTVIEFSAEAEALLAHRQNQIPDLRLLIEQVLSQDPRPAYRAGKDEARTFGMRLYDLDVRWRHLPGRILVTDIVEGEVSEASSPGQTP